MRNGTEKVTESVVGSALFLIEWERYCNLRNGAEKLTESGVGSDLILIEWERYLEKRDCDGDRIRGGVSSVPYRKGGIT